MRISDWSSDVCSSDLVLDQAGIDRRRERRIVEGHGHVRPFGLADFLPRRADVVARRLHAEVGGVLVVALVVGNQLDLDVERQGAKRAGVAVFLCGEGADVSHDVSPFGLNKVAPRSEEHTSELQSLMRISYAVFSLQQKNNTILYTT